MDYPQAMREMLATDVAITAIVDDDRIYENSALSRLGLPSETSTWQGALILVKGRAVGAGATFRDRGLGATDLRQVVEVWLYADGDAGYTTLDQLVPLIIAKFNGRKLAGVSGIASYAGYIKDRAPELGNACFYRLDFQISGIGVG